MPGSGWTSLGDSGFRQAPENGAALPGGLNGARQLRHINKQTE